MNKIIYGEIGSRYNMELPEGFVGNTLEALEINQIPKGQIV